MLLGMHSSGHCSPPISGTILNVMFHIYLKLKDLQQAWRDIAQYHFQKLEDLD